jgi:RNA-directed DNA polymerase
MSGRRQKNRPEQEVLRLQRVKANRGSPGVDGMTVDELPAYLKQRELEIGEQLRNGTYQPQPVLRFVQQAVLQVLQKRS